MNLPTRQPKCCWTRSRNSSIAAGKRVGGIARRTCPYQGIAAIPQRQQGQGTGRREAFVRGAIMRRVRGDIGHNGDLAIVGFGRRDAGLATDQRMGAVGSDGQTRAQRFARDGARAGEHQGDAVRIDCAGSAVAGMRMLMAPLPRIWPHRAAPSTRFGTTKPKASMPCSAADSRAKPKRPASET